MLKNNFLNIVKAYEGNPEYGRLLWKEIEHKHHNTSRYYHTLEHLERLYNALYTIKSNCIDWEIMIFSICYHDYVYDVHSQDNEYKSAEKAGQVLQLLFFDPNRIALCMEMILATKTHDEVTQTDINHFTDADLTILGSPWDIYQEYTQNIRKEYQDYPDAIYREGRCSSLKHFIAMPKIFKTSYFYDQFEIQAKKNLSKELDLLNSYS